MGGQVFTMNTLQQCHRSSTMSNDMMINKLLKPAFLAFILCCSIFQPLTAGESIQPPINEAIGFVCMGKLQPLSPIGFKATQFNATQMQEARAPQPIDMNQYNGNFVNIHWQVAEGDTLWGVTITPMDESQLKIRYSMDQPLKVEALPKK